MKKILSIVSLIYVAIVSAGNIKGTIANYFNREIIIKTTNGIDYYTIGTVETNQKGEFSYKVPQNHFGIFYLELDSNRRGISLLYDNQDLNLITNLEDLSVIDFGSDYLNSYYNYYKNSVGLNEKMSIVGYLSQIYSGNDPFYQPLRNEYKRLEALSKKNIEKPKNALLDYYIKTQEALTKADNIAVADEAVKERELIIKKLSTHGQMIENTGALGDYVAAYLRLGNAIYKDKSTLDELLKQDLDKMVNSVGLDTDRGQLIVAKLIDLLGAYGLTKVQKDYEKMVEKEICELSPILKEKIIQNNLLNLGNVLPDTAIPTNDKKLYNIKYDKYLILLFWSPECSHCVKDFPNIKNLYETYQKKGAELLAFSLDTNQLKYDEMIADTKWKNIYDKKNKITDFYHVMGTPTFLILNKNHEIIANASNAQMVLNYLK